MGVTMRKHEPLSVPCNSICAPHPRCHQHHWRRYHSSLLVAAPPLPLHVLRLHLIGSNVTLLMDVCSMSLCALNGLVVLCLGMYYRRFALLPRKPNGVSNDHSRSDRIFFGTKLFVGHGGGGGGLCGEAAFTSMACHVYGCKRSSL